MNRGFFGNMFDMNRDGKLDAWERTLDIMAFEEMMGEEERQSEDIWDDEEEDDLWDDDDDEE